MYKVILVDDEALTRESISQNVPWEEMEFELIGTAENGQEALNLIKECPPDLVLTDICMPVMDGLSLSEQIQKSYPNIKVVIISGYDDFEYAKQAMRYEVSNYIIKPITSHELVEELKRIKIKIEESINQTKTIEAAKKFEDNIPTLRNDFLNRLLEGNYYKLDIADKMNQYNIRFSGSLQAVVLLEVEEFETDTKDGTKIDIGFIDFSIANITEEIINKCQNVIFVKNTNNKSVLIFAEESAERLEESIQSVCNTIIEAVKQCIQTKMYVIVGETVNDVQNWVYSYQSVKEAKEYKFLFEDQKFVYGQEKVMTKTTRQDNFIRQIDHLILAIKLCNIIEIKQEIEYIFQGLRESGRDKRQLLIVVQNLVLSILIALETYTDGKTKEYDKEEFILSLSEHKHLSDIEKKFFLFCKELADIIAGKRENENEKQAIRALDYIEKNYMNIDISLNKVCDFLCVSTSYFSAIFKNATGETFIETLTRVRINKAKELLESTSMKNYEIALAVGYQDPHYFSSTFKKHVLMTPTEYTKQLQKGK